MSAHPIQSFSEIHGAETLMGAPIGAASSIATPSSRSHRWEKRAPNWTVEEGCCGKWFWHEGRLWRPYSLKESAQIEEAWKAGRRWQELSAEYMVHTGRFTQVHPADGMRWWDGGAIV